MLKKGAAMGLLQDKKILVTGLLSNRSIAYGIARALGREGATLAFTYQSDELKDRVTQLAADFRNAFVLPCDVLTTPRSRRCFLRWGHSGTGSTASCTPLPTRRGRRSRANSSTT